MAPAILRVVALAALLALAFAAAASAHEERSGVVLTSAGASLFNPFCEYESEEALSRAGRAFLRARGPRGEPLNPVVVVPGLGGSGIELALSRKAALHWYCTRRQDWFLAWVHLSELVVQDCWIDNMRLEYKENNSYSPPEGVQARARDFGGVNGIAYLDDTAVKKLVSYFSPLIKSLEATGYVVGKTLFGAPYDWRLDTVTHERAGYFSAVRRLVEKASADNGGRRVHLISHSMGCVMMNYFLTKVVDQAWKDKYIASFIPIAGPWLGSPKALRSVISGDTFGFSVDGVELVKHTRFRTVARNAGGVIGLFPNLRFGPATLVRTPKRTYNVLDMQALMQDLGGSQSQAAIYPHVRNMTLDVGEPPRVATFCVYGTGVKTEEQYTYADGDFDKNPTIEYTKSGDGTVPLDSLMACGVWAQEQAQQVQIVEFNLREHMGILKDEEMIKTVIDLLWRLH